ncbi:hypothetical protein ACHQM5_012091 [Ranunculus cassubicifolius]
MDPFLLAMQGDVEFFKTVSKDILLNTRDYEDRSVLDTAIETGNLSCCIEICKKCPELLYHQNKGRQLSSLMVAACGGNLSIVTCLVNAATEADLEKDIIVGAGEKRVPKRLLRMLDSEQCSALWFAVLHSRFRVAKFLMEADPEFEYVGEDLYTNPLILATRNASSGDRNAEKIRVLIIEEQISQRKMKERNWTTLHKAAFSGDVDAVKKMIECNSKQIDMVDSEKRNFVHLAAEFGHTEIIKFVLEEADISSRVLNAQDIHGNTPVHIAALSGNQSITLCFLYDSRVKKETLNTKGQNALEAAFEYDREKANGLR